jgi:hypothetical protein
MDLCPKLSDFVTAKTRRSTILMSRYDRLINETNFEILI